MASGSLRALDDRKSDIDGIAVENPCKGLRYHTADLRQHLIASGACSLEDPQPKFLSATMISPAFTFVNKVFVDILHTVPVASSYPDPSDIQISAPG